MLRGIQGLVTPFYRQLTRMFVGFGLAIAAGFATSVATREPMLGAGVSLLLAAAVAIISWLPFADPTFRRAAELFHDHNCHERAEWKATTGTPMPRGLPAVERWVAAHPDAPGRASLLVLLGRLDEADRAIANTQPKTPEEAFSLEITRQTRALAAGTVPDTASLHASWRALPDPRERRHRRECLAILDAQIAVEEGRDPLPVMAKGREEIDEVYWNVRVPWLMAKWASVVLLAIGSAGLLAVFLVGT
jgi:hypothetical protein